MKIVLSKTIIACQDIAQNIALAGNHLFLSGYLYQALRSITGQHIKSTKHLCKDASWR
jgi:hypothetical protein